MEIPKPKGGIRTVNVFSIPDAAVSNLLARRLIRRNQKRFSPASYAYRTDHGPLDAILLIKSIAQSPRLFLTEIDYSNYFDSIDHDYVMRVLANQEFGVSGGEMEIIREFMRYRYIPPGGNSGDPPIINNRGTPQGTSISLFVANVAAHSLDMELERRNGVFVRFADDSLVMTFSYEDANSLYSHFLSFEKQSTVKINAAKSSAVALFSAVPGEIKTKSQFSFLGYSFRRISNPDEVVLSISLAKIKNMKAVLSRLMNRPGFAGGYLV